MNKQRIRLIQEQYPPGTRIQLDSMSDNPCPIPAGTKGTVRMVNDMGTLHCEFDSVSHLILIIKLLSRNNQGLPEKEAQGFDGFGQNRQGCYQPNLGLPIFAVIMFVVYFISVTTVGTWVTDWTNDGLFGDGFHLFGIGSTEYDEATSAYAEENIFTDNVLVLAQSAAEAGVVGAEDVLGAIDETDFGAFDEALGSYGDSLAEAGFDGRDL